MTAAARRALLVLLLPALLLAQTLGLLHGTLHADGQGGAHVAVVSGHDHEPHAHGSLADLFGEHGDAPSCRLYDQLSHGDIAPPAAALPHVLPACVAAPFVLLRLVALAAPAAFDARAPPALR
jgi:hypothetical protein